jgi:mRNA interferase RelE/StbE
VRFAVIWAARAEKDRDGLDAVARTRVLAAIERYAESGHGDVARLAGRPGQYRLRAGDWRVLFALDASRAELIVQRVRHRREAYRD